MATSASINIAPSTHISGPVASPRIGSIGNGSFRDAVAGSLGREVSHIMDYSLSRFGTSASSDITVAPSTSYGNKLDTTFCRSFQCCGKPLEDLHELLAHYEEEHTKDDFEDEFTETMDDAMSDDGSSRSSKSPSPRMINSTPALLKRKAFDTGDDNDSPHSPLSAASKKRSYGSFSLNGPAGANVHQSLRRALIDGGVGSRRVPGSPSIYSANSPFSTPGSSIPGTPAVDQENEAYFSGALAANAFAGLSLRNGANEDHQMPSCAPPNLFFPAAGGSSSTMNGPPSKRERMNNGAAIIPSSSTSSMSASAAAAAAHEALSKVTGNSTLDSKPFKCPEPGCDKAYKQMNGLKYHKLHGHCNQNNLPPSLQTQAAHLKNVNGSGSMPNSPIAARKPGMPGDARQGTPGVNGDMAEPSTPTGSAPGSPRSNLAAGGSASAAAAAAAAAAVHATPEKMYLCQVGSCGKRYKNLNGLRYHYLHSGSHGLLGLQLLHANGGGASAKMDPATGNATVSTLNLSEEAVAAAARAAAEQQAARVQKLHALQNAQKAAAAAAAASSSGTAGAAGAGANGVAGAGAATSGLPGMTGISKVGMPGASGTGLPGSAAGLVKAGVATSGAGAGVSAAGVSAAGAAPVKLSAALNEMPDMPTLAVVNVSHPANAAVSGNTAAVQALAANTAALGKANNNLTSATTTTSMSSSVSPTGSASSSSQSGGLGLTGATSSVAAAASSASASTPGIAIPTAPGTQHHHHSHMFQAHQRMPTLAPAPLPGAGSLVSPPSSTSTGGMSMAMDMDSAPSHAQVGSDSGLSGHGGLGGVGLGVSGGLLGSGLSSGNGSGAGGLGGLNSLSTLVSPSNGMLSSLSTSAGGLLGSSGLSLGASPMEEI
ncbi:Transcriptional regulator of ribosomal biogenesis proteins [Tilletia horrida]|nr:Transcriptional regulator of ribosomal biogenesis proteins [Tilletia horrida]KAK0535999.1 Transcriptional regulator of ribosomal biogenesis proteins [Tilletia horrida]KAK0551139.1 Transcriptional regulator of ribosomal biogenesis proteins [Tilletia horrida]